MNLRKPSLGSAIGNKCCMNNVNPLVSIIIACFNGEPYLGDAVESCLGQTYLNIEIIIVDDGSADRSVEIAEKYASSDSRVKIFPALHKGYLGAINFGLDITKGEYVKFLDQDDLLSPCSIEYQVRSLIFFKAEMAIARVFLFESAKLADARKKMPSKTPFSASDNIAENILDFLKRLTGSFSGSLFSKAALQKAGKFNPALKSADEVHVWLKIAIAFPGTRVVYCKLPMLILKRVGDHSAASKFMDIRWLLLSLEGAARDYLEKSPPQSAKLKKYIFDRLYIIMAYSYRDGLKNAVFTALGVWKKAGLRPPIIEPWYHNALHRALGFTFAEGFLSKARQLRSQLLRSKQPRSYL